MRTFLVTFLFTTYRHNIFHLPYFSTPFTDLTSVRVVINSCPSDYPPTVHGESLCLPLEASRLLSTPFTDLTFVHVVINSCPSDYPPTVHGTSMCLPLEASSTTGSPLDTRQGTVKDFLHSAKDTRRRKSR